MKRKLLVITGLLFTIVLSGCSKETKEESAYKNIKAEDAVYDDDLEGYNIRGGMCQTDSGYYFVSNNFRINYIDRETMEATPLCFDPACNHPMNGECPAYFYGCANIQNYHGKIYADKQEYRENGYSEEVSMVLYEMDMDGSNRKQVAELYDSEVVGAYGDTAIVEWRIIGGKLYVWVSHGTGPTECYAYLDCYSGENWSEVERILEWDYEDTHISDSVISSLYYDAESEELYCGRNIWKIIDDVLYVQSEPEVINLEKNTKKRILEGEILANVVCCCNQVFYENESNLYYYNKETGESEKMVELGEDYKLAQFIAGKKYLYVNNSPMLTYAEDGEKPKVKEAHLLIYDVNGKLVEKMAMPVGGTTTPLDADDKQFYLVDMTKMYYIEKDKIGTGELELKEVKGVQ